MRVDKNDPRIVYDGFFDWLQTDNHFVWIISLVFAYVYYLMTTEEV